MPIFAVVPATETRELQQFIHKLYTDYGTMLSYSLVTCSPERGTGRERGWSHARRTFDRGRDYIGARVCGPLCSCSDLQRLQCMKNPSLSSYQSVNIHHGLHGSASPVLTATVFCQWKILPYLQNQHTSRAPIDRQNFVTGLYVGDTNSHGTFGANPSTRDLWANG